MRVLITLLAAALVVLTGCGATTTDTTTAGASITPSLTETSVVPTMPGKSRASHQPVPVRGWSDDIVRAGDTAYVVGWNAENSGALWHADATGALSSRAAPPGMPGNPGLTAPGRVLDLAFGDSTTGLAITGTDGDRNRPGHKNVYLTTDGAHTWTRVDPPTSEQPEGVAIGGGAAYVLTSNCARPTGACNHATLWSIDPTGATRPHSFDSLPNQADTSGPIAVAGHGDDVWAWLNMGAGDGTGLRSIDGGRTWHRFDVDCLWEQPVATSGSVVWAICGSGMNEHFTRQAELERPVGVFSTDISGTSNSTLQPLTDSTAYAVIDNRHGTRIEVTHDGGHTTSTLAPIPQSIARRGFRTVFVSEHVGYLVTLNGGELYRTDDAHTWQKISTPRAAR